MRLGDDGLLEAEGRHWAVLQFDTPGSAFQLDGERHLDGLLNAPEGGQGRSTGAEILHAGVPLHAEAAAVQANREINTIGWGSLAAVLLLVWLAFRSLRPILLVAASLLIGCGVALAVTVLVFGKVHVLTLVFGASLVGVAEDYGIHWFASRQAEPADRRWKLLRHLLPGLWLALLTSALAYLALGPAFRPAPDGAVLGGRPGGCFPHGDLLVPVARWRRDPPDPVLAVAGQYAGTFPRLHGRRAVTMFVVITLALSAIGIARLHSNDDLQPAVITASVDGAADPPEPAAGHAQPGAVLPGAGWMLRSCCSAEALTERLRVLANDKRIGGYRAISDWSPSPARQQADAALTAKVEPGVLSAVSEAVGEPLQRPQFAAAPLTAEAFLASPASQPFRHLWVGEVGGQMISVVMVDDLSRADALATLEGAAEGLPGVRCRPHLRFLQAAGPLPQADGRAAAGRHRTGVRCAALRYRRQAWRVFAPTLIAGALTLGLLGLFGQPLQLFNVLALMLLLGIDYGIFLIEHRGDASAWLAVCVGAASTWLSFGLLGLS